MILKQAEQFAYRVAMPWYHVSPYELPEGTRLVPGGNKSLYEDDREVLSDRMKHVWVTDSPEHAHDWAQVAYEQTGHRPRHIYEVEPESEPQIWDQEYPDDEWYTSGATIKKRLR